MPSTWVQRVRPHDYRFHKPQIAFRFQQNASETAIKSTHASTCALVSTCIRTEFHEIRILVRSGRSKITISLNHHFPSVVQLNTGVPSRRWHLLRCDLAALRHTTPLRRCALLSLHSCSLPSAPLTHRKSRRQRWRFSWTRCVSCESKRRILSVPVALCGALAFVR